jgi:ssDNA-specific exonuclease RecJ
MKPNHYLIPDWFEREALSKHYNVMQKFAPFTIRSIGSMDAAEILEYQNELLIFIDLIDDMLRKNA